MLRRVLVVHELLGVHTEKVNEKLVFGLLELLGTDVQNYLVVRFQSGILKLHLHRHAGVETFLTVIQLLLLPLIDHHTFLTRFASCVGGSRRRSLV